MSDHWTSEIDQRIGQAITKGAPLLKGETMEKCFSVASGLCIETETQSSSSFHCKSGILFADEIAWERWTSVENSFPMLIRVRIAARRRNVCRNWFDGNETTSENVFLLVKVAVLLFAGEKRAKLGHWLLFGSVEEVGNDDDLLPGTRSPFKAKSLCPPVVILLMKVREDMTKLQWRQMNITGISPPVDFWALMEFGLCQCRSMIFSVNVELFQSDLTGKKCIDWRGNCSERETSKKVCSMCRIKNKFVELSGERSESGEWRLSTRWLSVVLLFCQSVKRVQSSFSWNGEQ